MIDCDTSPWPECFDCGEEFNPRRKALGYEHCLNCGEKHAKKESDRKAKCTAPLFNKGAYQYVGSFEDAKNAGR